MDDGLWCMDGLLGIIYSQVDLFVISIFGTFHRFSSFIVFINIFHIKKALSLMH
jgi:hypothetical protein